MKPPPPPLVCARAFAERTKKTAAGATAIRVCRRLRPPGLGLRAPGDPTAFARGTLGRVSPQGAHGLERLRHPSLSRGVPRPAPGSMVAVPPPTAAAQRVAPPPAVRRVRTPTDFSRAGDRLVPAVRL